MFMFVEMFKLMLLFLFGFAAGCMVWIVFVEFLLDVLVDLSDLKYVVMMVIFSVGVLEVFRMIMEGVECYGEVGSVARDGAVVVALSVMDVGLVVVVYVLVGVLVFIYVFLLMMLLLGFGLLIGIGIVVSMVGMSVAFWLLWVVWRGVAGGVVFVFVVLGGFMSVLGGILVMCWMSSLLSLCDMCLWSDIDDDDV